MIRETRAPESEEATEMHRTLPSSAYLSQETFERERERIFATEWFCAGRGEASCSRSLPEGRRRRGEHPHRPDEVRRAPGVLQRVPTSWVTDRDGRSLALGRRAGGDGPIQGLAGLPLPRVDLRVGGGAPAGAVPHRERRSPPRGALAAPGRG